MNYSHLDNYATLVAFIWEAPASSNATFPSLPPARPLSPTFATILACNGIELVKVMSYAHLYSILAKSSEERNLRITCLVNGSYVQMEDVRRLYSS